jgi:hypothetical protein
VETLDLLLPLKYHIAHGEDPLMDVAIMISSQAIKVFGHAHACDQPFFLSTI